MSATPTSPKEGKAPFAIPSLDGLRAVSFLLVFLGHAGVPFIPFAIPAGFGVTVFFFLSGYLITTLLRLETEEHGRVNFKLFYLRRLLRIWPPFYLVLLGASLLVVTGAVTDHLKAPSVLAQVLHYCNYWLVYHGADGMAPGTVVYWSLAVEEHFYLVFPAMFTVLVRARFSPRKQRAVFFAICLLTLAWRCLLIWTGSSYDRTYLATDTRFDSMLFGCSLAVCDNPALDLPKKERPEFRDLLFFGAGIAALLTSFLIRAELFRETLRYTVQGFALIPVFVSAIRFPRWGIFRFLNLRPVRYVGTISYSLYLVHQVIMRATDEWLKWSPGPMAALNLAIALAVSSAMWQFIEKPFGVLRKRLTTVRHATA